MNLRPLKNPTIIIAVLAALVLSPILLLILAQYVTGKPDYGLEIARLLYSWPVATASVLILLLVRYREAMSILIAGIRRFKVAGVEIETEQKGLPQTAKDPRKGETSWEEWLMDLGRKLSPTDVDVIKNLGVQQQLVLASWIKSWWFEKIWGMIFGTQIALVEHGVQNGKPVSLQEARVFFEKHISELVRTNPLSAWSVNDPTYKEVAFCGYIKFLEDARFVEKKDDALTMTQLANEFLTYMRNQNYSKEGRVW